MDIYRRFKGYKSSLALLTGLLMLQFGPHQSAAASDLEIYKSGEKGKIVLTLMLDTSGSMNFADKDDGTVAYCMFNAANTPPPQSAGNVDIEYIHPTDSSQNQSFSLTKYTCDGVPTRLSMLQESVMKLLADHDKLSDDIKIGLGNFSTNGNGRTGNIILPAKKLSPAHRKDLISKILSFKGSGGTPTAHAYSEVGSYMMGTTNSEISSAKRIIGVSSGSYYSKCMQNSTNVSDLYGNSVLRCLGYASWTTNSGVVQPNDGNFSDNSYTYYYVNESGYTSAYSGFSDSSDETKKSDGLSYQTPIIKDSDTAECDGNGIYFLTDGEPNGTDWRNGISNNSAKTVMDKSLSLSALTVDCSVNGSITDSGSYSNLSQYHAWTCIGDYAKKLRDTTNPSGVEIKTAVVGYGGAFKSASEKIVDPESGKSYVNCNAIPSTNTDARNACNWGAKTYDGEADTNINGTKLSDMLSGVGGYGEGGFYYAANGDEVAASIVDFAQSLGGEIKPLPSGETSIPVDALDSSLYRPVAYLPLLEPKPESANVIWAGNLKKYKIKKGTLFGKDDEKLFTDYLGNLNGDTMDLWNKTSNADNANVQVGGTYDRIYDGTTDRKLWVNNASDLKSIKISEGKVSGLSTDETNGFKKTSLTNKHRRQLANFLGYAVNASVNAQLTTSDTDAQNSSLAESDIEFNPAHRVHGGVVHSKPVSVTYSANVNSTTGEFENRKDFVLYGSMDGALHVVDQDTGKEAMTFVPKEIIQSQGKAFVPGAIHGETKPVHGVDAPWVVHSELDYNNDGTKLVAKKVYAYGGLRMGGTNYYGLDISDINNPKLLFNIGRSKKTYDADTGELSSEQVGGFINEASKSAFARLGQSWAKPAITAVWHKGQRILVAIISGGYDPQFEDPYFNPGSNETLGNAVYMVAAEDNSKANVKAGQLIGWVSSSATGKQKVDDMRYSIVTEPKLLDRNNDGLTDHIYVADLYGQLFRIDLENTMQDADAVKFRRTVRVLDASSDTGSANGKNDAPPRFYEMPVVTFHNFNGVIAAAVSIASGDRSNPLHKRGLANRLYTVIDRDIANPKLFRSDFNDSTLKTKDITAKAGAYASKTNSDKDRLAEMRVEANRTHIQDDIIKGNVAGWFYSITYFDGDDGLNGVKAYGQSINMGNALFVTMYYPEANGGVDKCVTGIAGQTESQRYCLPYGICDVDSPGQDVLGYLLGQGIQALALGYRGDSDSDPSGKGRETTYGFITIGGEDDQTPRKCGADGNDDCGDPDPDPDPKDPDLKDDCISNPNLPECLKDGFKVLRPLYWFERR